VDDHRGGSDEQDYTILVQAGQPWPPLAWPPHFTSTPVVDAVVTQPYSYQATAFEPALPGGWTLTFSELSGPTGLSCPSNGLVTWTPTAAQLGLFPVVLQVSDGNGGTDTQGYSIF